MSEPDLPTDPDAYTRGLAANHPDDPSGWFEDLYVAAGRGQATVPWDRGVPNPLLVDWVASRGPTTDARVVVVGAGLGRDSEYLASLGYDVTAFDVSPTAVAMTRTRFPQSGVTYTVGDLLDLPAEWVQAFDLVVESMNVQALPQPGRDRAVAGVASLVAPGGTLFVVEFGFDGTVAERDAEPGPPWPLTRREVDRFAVGGVEPVSVRRVVLEADAGTIRWVAEFRRP